MQAAILQKTSQELVEKFQETLFNLCNQKGKKMVDRYMKQMVVSRGIPYNNQSYIFDRFWTSEVAGSIAQDEKKVVADMFIKSKYAEDKIVGMKIINSFNKEIDTAYIDAMKKYYTDGHIKGWAMSDKFSLTVLNPWGKLSQGNTEYLSGWRTDKNEWIRRSSCIAFFQRARFGDKNQMNFNGFMDLMYKISNHVVKQEQRYNQMAVGQLLREMTLARGFKQKTIDFIKERKTSFNDESIRIAISKLNSDTKKSILNLGKTYEQIEAKQELTYYEKMAKKKEYIQMQKERKMYVQIKRYLGIAKKDR